jgi:hypothetical protein
VAACAVVAAMRTVLAFCIACLLAAGCGGSASGVRTRSVPWRLERVADDGRRLSLRYERGACDRLERAQVAERERAVTVTVLVTNDDSERACIMVLAVGRTQVRLRTPLGGRRLLHGQVTTVSP